MHYLGDPAILHRLIFDEIVDTSKIEHCDGKIINDAALACGMRMSGKSKVGIVLPVQ